jgi:hypothetical protein
VDAEWINDTDVQELVWYQGGRFMSIHVLPPSSNHRFAPEHCKLDKDDLVAIANSLQLASTFEIPPTPTEVSRYPLSLEELIAVANVNVYLPVYVPQAYIFEGANTFENLAAQNYICGDNWGFSITQSRNTLEESRTAVTEIGASATVEEVQIGDVTGQYLRGKWFLPPFEATPPVEVGDSVEVTAEWINTTEWQQLIWYDGEYLFRIRTSNGTTWITTQTGFTYPLAQADEDCALDKEDFVAIGNSLQPAVSLSE